jgi:hypothetical protein
MERRKELAFAPWWHDVLEVMRREEVDMATSTGPQQADFTRCELDSQGKPSGSEYSSTPKVAKQPERLPLPAGKQNDKNIPQEKIN